MKIDWDGEVDRSQPYLALVILGTPFEDESMSGLPETTAEEDLHLMRSRVLRTVATVGMRVRDEEAVAVELTDEGDKTTDRVERILEKCKENHRLTKGPLLAYAFHHAQSTANQLSRPYRWLIVTPEDDSVPRRV